jgi:hypothetical protein
MLRVVRAPLVLALVLVCAASASRARAQDGYPASQGYPVPAVGGVPMPSRKVTLLRSLDEHLQRIAEQSDGRVLDGTISVVLGSAFVGLGIWVDDPLLRSIMFMTGGISVGRGVNELTLAPDAGGVYGAFRGMSVATPADVEARLRFGDAALAMLARRTRAARIVEGSLTMAGAASYVPLYWYFQHQEDPSYRFGDDGVDYVGLALSIIGFTSGLVTSLRKSNAERRNASYRELKHRLYPVALVPQVSPQAARLVLALRY